MKMNIVLILFLSINGINCLRNGMPVDVSPAYTNFLVTIRDYRSETLEYRCSGSIITQRHVVTAGHCVHDVGSHEIYVTAGRLDLDDISSLMVDKIHLHHNFKKIKNPYGSHAEYWLNDIAILDLVLEFTWRLHIAPIALNFGKWTNAISDECYIIGWNCNPIDTTTSPMILQWAETPILGNTCSQLNTFLLKNEIYAFITTVPTTLDDTDIGNSLICNGQAMGIVVGGRGLTHSLLTVLTLSPYQQFIEYIIAGGMAKVENWELNYVVSIWHLGTFICGGFMVYNRYAVTAAHCMKDVEGDYLSVVSAHSEIPRINPSSKWSLIENIYIHPLYKVFYDENSKELVRNNDIAVLELTSNLPWSPTVGLRHLPYPSKVSADTPCEIPRWTHPSYGDPSLKVLKKSHVRILNYEGNGSFEIKKFRAKGFQPLPIATNDDIGNPIIFDNSIIGMVIATDLSASGTIDSVICLNIFQYTNFITRVLMGT